MKQKQDLEL